MQSNHLRPETQTQDSRQVELVAGELKVKKTLSPKLAL